MSESEMRYFSTRGGSETLSFEDAVLTGLAPNGGLYIPTHIPSLPADWQTKWASLSFPELSREILSLFIPTSVIPSKDLSQIINTAYSTFRSEKTTPLRQTGEKEYVLELWHGPTWAFKDVALQFLGELFRYFLERRNGKLEKEGKEEREELTVVGATSGDTGSAAIYGLRSKPSITIFILYPDGRISPIQEAQMATVPDENVYCVAVQDSDFDTCQSIVKTLFSDKEFNSTHRLGAINSINWARILAQIVYYFSAYFQLPESARAEGAKVQFSVPTGNFGDILAGWFAKRLGLPMDHLVVATNENDILDRFFRTGRYEAGEEVSSSSQAPETAAVNGSSDGQQATPSSGSSVKSTHSPAMDILLSSNFERLLYYLALDTLEIPSGDAEQDRARAQEHLNGWMAELKKNGKVNLGERIKEAAGRDFWSERVSDGQTLEEIRKYYQLPKYGPYVVDPHTAVGLAATERSQKKAPNSYWVTLSTAHPAKFSSAVELALSAKQFPEFNFRETVLPEELKKLEQLEKRVHKINGEAGVRELIERVKKGEKVVPGEGKGSI
ncbi:threonine synthase [Kwoniella dejecticola CBS 10117]|uniref:threonine synthase n=1 Tax=Kwoniella dejecticola CBS 10117 TaxID=1296121 RepID=A0A1A6A855_9TREE|nr:threonine synthase [Kwoniella dejecticola CBS 10117]OBR86240.1 threonine synthase [Kwoniella dejecticola CBS 10117]